MRKKAGSLTKPSVYIPLALVTCALWGSAFPCVKLGYIQGEISGVPSQMVFAGLRFVYAGFLTWIFGSVISRRSLPLPGRVWGPSSFFGLIQTALEYALFYTALSMLAGSTGSMINGTSAIFSILAAWALPPHEKLTREKVIGSILGLCGVVYLNLAGLSLGSSYLLGCLLMLGAAAVTGVSNVILSKISGCGSAYQITCVQLAVGGSVLLILGLSLGGRIGNFSFPFFGLLTYMSFLTATSFTIWTNLMRENPVGKISIFMFSIPVFGVIFSGLILHEPVFTLTNFIALLLICTGIALVNRS